jgi:hypothetical protein
MVVGHLPPVIMLAVVSSVSQPSLTSSSWDSLARKLNAEGCGTLAVWQDGVLRVQKDCPVGALLHTISQQSAATIGLWERSSRD